MVSLGNKGKLWEGYLMINKIIYYYIQGGKEAKIQSTIDAIVNNGTGVIKGKYLASKIQRIARQQGYKFFLEKQLNFKWKVYHLGN